MTQTTGLNNFIIKSIDRSLKKRISDKFPVFFGIFLMIVSAGGNETGTEQGCPEGWNVYTDNCYFRVPEYVEFSNAVGRCKRQDASLVSVSSKQENHFLTDLVSASEDDTFWIGLRHEKINFHWLDGALVMWSAWSGVNEPSMSCGLMVRGRWTADFCVHYHQFICKKSRARGKTASQISTNEQIFQSIPKTSATDFKTFTEFSQTNRQLQPTTENVSILMQTVKPKKNPGRTRSDNRVSSIGIGSVGAFVLIAIIAWIIILDGSRLYTDLTGFAKMVKRLCKRKSDISTCNIKINKAEEQSF
ncbi:hypothetical protein CHS0354_005206 [Potamilus streckersoni]|uniref:C-type lectin domain-containing protein n=1 Tax=Potamilus streckersoni TaxID=2493646 RepID=A0AAE0S3N4_9BIVA|nr:hypothetical protein CHS0354_005206 [Potamilus streckersoni]